MKPLYDESIPVFIKYLGNLIKLIEKTEAHARKHKIPINSFLKKRLHKTMFAFREQVGYAYFIPLELTEKITGKKIPAFGYDETSMSELKTSLRRAISFLQSIKPKDFKGTPGTKIRLFLDTKRKVDASHYVREIMMPDFFFHYTTAYDILRHSGVAVGKSDYLGAL